MILKNRYFLVIVALLIGSFIGFKLTETFAIKYIITNGNSTDTRVPHPVLSKSCNLLTDMLIEGMKVRIINPASVSFIIIEIIRKRYEYNIQ